MAYATMPACSAENTLSSAAMSRNSVPEEQNYYETTTEGDTHTPRSHKVIYRASKEARRASGGSAQKSREERERGVCEIVRWRKFDERPEGRFWLVFSRDDVNVSLLVLSESKYEQAHLVQMQRRRYSQQSWAPSSIGCDPVGTGIRRVGELRSTCGAVIRTARSVRRYLCEGT